MENIQKQKKEESAYILIDKKKQKSSVLKHPTILLWLLPTFLFNFIFSKEDENHKTKILVRAGIGLFMGLGLYTLGWTTSNYFRCSSLLVIPSIMESKANLLTLVISVNVILGGPLSNMYSNAGELVKSFGCTVELKINHTKMMFQVAVNPIKKIFMDLYDNSGRFKNFTKGLIKSFQGVKDEVESTEGYDKARGIEMLNEEKKKNNGSLSTQQELSTKSMLRCEDILEKGISKCQDWFAEKHKACQDTIKIPVLKSIICFPMKFRFLCKLQKVTIVLCKIKLKIDPNIGAMYNHVSSIVNKVDSGFKTEIVMLMTATQDLFETMDEKKGFFHKIKTALRAGLSLTFIFFLCSAYGYVTQYNCNVWFDNNYITTYFKQIDARRRKRKQRHLLPLCNGEYINFIFPFKPALQASEKMTAGKSLHLNFPFIIFFFVALVSDYSLYQLFVIVNKHSFITYAFSSQHKLEVAVQGDSFLAKLLNNTIGRLNTSSEMLHLSDNAMCLPRANRLTTEKYVIISIIMSFVVLLPFIQAYMCRFRRAVTAFFFPKREKQRILFMYNQQLRKRQAYAEMKRKEIILNAKRHKFLLNTLAGFLYKYFKCLQRFIIRRCLVCKAKETKDSYVCRTPNCTAVYCRQCWKDMKRFCYVCTPCDDFIADINESDYEFEDE
ncbi:hypothetical protein GDO86_011719 [Hymenochirus boettgeri]|uniref:DC-STAMP domain containing 1 n=1 Tax=Hymenochirus boettgeri TaxID=247094 RepID=A0A8T2JCM7_9PIPI|nr:hypothetical protein GDO86_011719 [Hymenochirus boettgeri]